MDVLKMKQCSMSSLIALTFDPSATVSHIIEFSRKKVAQFS